MNLFGKKKVVAPVVQRETTVDTIKMLRTQLDTLEKRENHIEKKVQATLLDATTRARAKDKKGALFALKRKKLYEAEVSKLQGAKITLESQINALESAVVNIETFYAMNAGKNAMKTIRKDIDSDRVDQLMDDMEEENDIHDQISNAISRGHGDPLDDEDLENELNDLLAADEERLQAAPPSYVAPQQTVFDLPSVPTATLPKSQKQTSRAESEEEVALRELQAAMLA